MRKTLNSKKTQQVILGNISMRYAQVVFFNEYKSHVFDGCENDQSINTHLCLCFLKYFEIHCLVKNKKKINYVTSKLDIFQTGIFHLSSVYLLSLM